MWCAQASASYLHPCVLTHNRVWGGIRRWGRRVMGMGYRLIASVHMAEHAMGAFLSVAVVNTFTSALQC